MQATDTTKTPACASALEKIADVYGLADDLQYDLHRLNCLASVAQGYINNILFREHDVNERPGFYYVADIEKKILGFADSEINTLSADAEVRVDRMLDGLKEVKAILNRHQPEELHAPKLNSDLDMKIDAWQLAYELWLATDKGDGSDLQCDIPEARLEQAALEALVKHPCASLVDVRRKAKLFSNSEYLQGQACDFTFDLMASFADMGEE